MEDHRNKVFAHLNIQLDEVATTYTCFKGRKRIFRIMGPKTSVCRNEIEMYENYQKMSWKNVCLFDRSCFNVIF